MLLVKRTETREEFARVDERGEFSPYAVQNSDLVVGEVIAHALVLGFEDEKIERNEHAPRKAEQSESIKEERPLAQRPNEGL